MQAVFLGFSGIQFGLLLVGLFLLFWRRQRVEKIMVTQLVATLCVGLILTLGAALQRTELYDVALVLTLLAAITTVAFVRLGWGETDSTS